MIDKNANLKSELNKVLDLMLITGQLFRACGATGICYYLITVSALSVYCLPDVIPRLKFFDYLSGNRFVAYLIEPEIERNRASSRVDRFLNNVMESNVNITNIFASKLRGNNFYYYYKKICPSIIESEGSLKSIDNNQTKQSMKNPHKQNQIRGIDSERKFSIEKDDNLYYSRYTRSLLRVNNGKNYCSIDFLARLQDQLKYLIKLKYKKHKIWPPCRDATWANQIKTLFKKFYTGALIMSWIFGHLIAYSVISSSFNLIKLSKFDAKYQRVTLFDRLSGVTTFLNCYICVLMSLTPTTILFICIIDILRHFAFVGSKVNQFCCRLKELDRLRHGSRFKHSIVAGINHYRRDLYSEYDDYAIELYINYLIFRDEIRANIEVAQNAATQCVCFLLIFIVPIIPFVRSILREETGILTTITIVCFLTVDLALLLCGKIHTNCLKQSRRIWNFIAYAENFNIEALNSTSLFKSKFDYGHQNVLIRNSSGTDYNTEDNLNYEYHLHGFMTYHTMLLWRRLAMHDELVLDQFICKLFGTFKINSRNILRYNYWLVSFVLIILNGTSI